MTVPLKVVAKTPPDTPPDTADGGPRDYPIRKRLTHDLALRIIGGEIPPGSRLPIESDLVESYGVSRTALREAVRTLAAKGLIVSRKKAGTIVLPPGDWNMLDAELLAWMGDVDMGDAYLHDVSEARLIFEPKAARLAATRADARQIAEIAMAFQRMEDAATRADWVAADVAFHRAVLNAANNHVLAQFGNVLSTALRILFRKTADNDRHYKHALEAHRDVMDAIIDGAPDEAEAAIEALIAKSNHTLAISNLVT